MMLTVENSWSVHQSALWKSCQQSHLVVNWEDLGEGNGGFCLWIICFTLVNLFCVP
jgi:hypothetical protein